MARAINAREQVERFSTSIGDVMQLEGAGTTAAVILEPIPGANGVLVPPPEYWPLVRDACNRDGALLIADEVLTGFGRTGRAFGFEHWGVVPDIITLAKGLTGGYVPMGAVLVHDRVARVFEEKVLAEYDRVLLERGESPADRGERAASRPPAEGTPEGAPGLAAADKTLEEVEEIHLRDSFWTV